MITILPLLSNCASDLKRAEQLLGQEAPHQAAPIFEKVLTQEPENKKALHGLKKARALMLSQDLIQIRMMRLGGHQLAAVNKLEVYYQNSETWGSVAQNPALYQSQNEETGWAIRLLNNEITDAHTKNYPLKILYIRARFQKIIQAVSPKIRQNWEHIAQEAGSKLCVLGFSKLSDYKPAKYFYIETLRAQICQRFAVEGSNFDTTIPPELVSKMIIAVPNNSLNKYFEGPFNDLISSSIRKLPWWHENAKNSLNLNMDGELKDSFQKDLVNRTHHYQEQVPYEIYEPVQRTISTTRLIVKNVYDETLKREVEKEVPVTETQTFWESVKKTKYRAESRQYPYQAHFSKRNLELHAMLKIESSQSNAGDASRIKLDYPIYFEHRDEGYSHNVRNSFIGLYPEVFSPIDTHTWTHKIAGDLSTKINEDLKTKWRSLYCDQTPAQAAQGAPYLNDLLRCARLAEINPNEELPIPVNAWLQSNWGVTFAELKIALLVQSTFTPIEASPPRPLPELPLKLATTDLQNSNEKTRLRPESFRPAEQELRAHTR